MFETTRLLRFCTFWLIHQHASQLNIEEQVSRLRGGLTELDDALPQVLTGADLQAFERARNQYQAANVPEGLSKRMASFIALRSGPDLVEIAEQKRLPVERAAATYFKLGTTLALDWLREQIETLEVEGHWQSVARTSLRDNVYNLQRSLALQVLNEGGKRDPEQAVAAWTKRHQRAFEYVRQTINDMRALPEMDFATLSVAMQAVRRMAESGK
jgi:glutamate dehydrogenase